MKLRAGIGRFRDPFSAAVWSVFCKMWTKTIFLQIRPGTTPLGKFSSNWRFWRCDSCWRPVVTAGWKEVLRAPAAHGVSSKWISCEIHLQRDYNGWESTIAFFRQTPNLPEDWYFFSETRITWFFSKTSETIWSSLEKSLKKIRTSQKTVKKLFRFYLFILGWSCTHLPQEREITALRSVIFDLDVFHKAHELLY